MDPAQHFRAHVDRVSLPHVELALRLYNDTALLRHIVNAAGLPEGALRVAISLRDAEEGPFLVVTREGRFVTSLGEGMSVDDLPVITHRRLQAMADRIGPLRRRLDDSRTVAGPHGSVRKALRRIHDAGDELSREEMTAFAQLAPLYSFELFYFFMDAVTDLADSREFFEQIRRAERFRPSFREALHAFYQTYWSIGHFAVLTALNGKGALMPFPKPVLEGLEEASVSWGAVRQGNLALALKGIWAVAHLGERLLPATKARFVRSASPLTYLDSAMGLVALGLGHPSLTAEVRGTLAAGPPKPKDDPIGRLLHLMHAPLVHVFDADEQAAAQLDHLHVAFGASVWQSVSRQLAPGSPLRFERAEDVPENLARCMAVNAQADFLSEPRMTVPMFSLLPWVVRATAEMLYLPRVVLDALHVPWEPEHSLALLRAHRDYYEPPAAAPAGPSRQGPCPCGSGKKYKRCCGMAKDETR